MSTLVMHTQLPCSLRLPHDPAEKRADRAHSQQSRRAKAPSLYEPRPGLAFSFAMSVWSYRGGGHKPTKHGPVGSATATGKLQARGQAVRPPPPQPHHAQHHAQHYTCRSVALAVQPLIPSRMPGRRSAAVVPSAKDLPWSSQVQIPIPSSRPLPLAGGRCYVGLEAFRHGMPARKLSVNRGRQVPRVGAAWPRLTKCCIVKRSHGEYGIKVPVEPNRCVSS